MFKSVNWRSQKGIGLAETLIAVAIMGTAVVAYVVALSVGSLSANNLDKETMAQSIAQAQIEFTKNSTYTPGATTYPTVTTPATFSVTVNVAAVPSGDTNIQKITVTVSKSGVNVITVTDYKVNR